MNLGQFATAVEILERAESASRNTDAWKPCLAVAYHRLGDPRHAVETWRGIADGDGLARLDSWERAELADALAAEAGKLCADSVAIYQDLLAAAGNDPAPMDLAFHAWAALRLGEPDDAITHYRRAIEEATDPFRVVRAQLAIAQFLAGRPDEGTATLAELGADIKSRRWTTPPARRRSSRESASSSGCWGAAPARPDDLQVLAAIRPHLPAAEPQEDTP